MPVTAFTATIAAATLSLPLATVAFVALPLPQAEVPRAETVTVRQAPVDFPLPGEFLLDGRRVAAPVEAIAAEPFSITTYQVSRDAYGACVTAGACLPPSASRGRGDAPVTGVSFLDAQAYAAWYSGQTGETWRLPTARETAIAAAERFAVDADPAVDDPSNPAARWLRTYQAEAAAKRAPDPLPKPRGHYGANSLGIEDFGGNVWEWTSTCYVRVTLDAEGRTAHVTENCGVRVIEGRHRSYMTEFIRDPKSGGCAVGTPPDNLGFRLVREEPAFPAVAWLKRRIAALVGGPPARET